MTSIDIATAHNAPAPVPVAVQLLSTLFFGVFGILAVIFAFDASWIAGLIVALVLGWRGGFAPGHWGNTPSIKTLIPLAPKAEKRSSGNASFDAYRTDTLRRLEDEQISFQSFLERLRAAKDKSEFDDFLDQRARRATNSVANVGGAIEAGN